MPRGPPGWLAGRVAALRLGVEFQATLRRALVGAGSFASWPDRSPDTGQIELVVQPVGHQPALLHEAIDPGQGLRFLVVGTVVHGLHAAALGEHHQLDPWRGRQPGRLPGRLHRCRATDRGAARTSASATARGTVSAGRSSSTHQRPSSTGTLSPNSCAATASRAGWQGARGRRARQRHLLPGRGPGRTRPAQGRQPPNTTGSCALLLLDLDHQLGHQLVGAVRCGSER
jgi:hypothetical protein